MRAAAVEAFRAAVYSTINRVRELCSPATTASTTGQTDPALLREEFGSPDLRVPLNEFARVLNPGGRLGFFEGSAVEKFDHAVIDAYKWPVAQLSRELDAAGFEVIETHTRTGTSYRPHGAIVARRR